MTKKLIAAAALTAALVAPMAGTAGASNGNGNGNGNGRVGCTLSNNSTYETPGKMLKHLTQRDGHFQNTVDRYGFGTVANLIDQKCGA